MSTIIASTNAAPPCGWCGRYHGPRCPIIKALEYHPDGSIKRVEYLDWDQQLISLGPRLPT